ncbi:unnamed protein product [Rhizoctonia solani]|uniref:Uncharacterized protein n=1 Tax=Rhizoctonia solani TaxID=456999 RepID=A0A8H3DWA5_9AGAM|nr:unnamed protein product [Rhizoctonia solani]
MFDKVGSSTTIDFSSAAFKRGDWICRAPLCTAHNPARNMMCNRVWRPSSIRYRDVNPEAFDQHVFLLLSLPPSLAIRFAASFWKTTPPSTTFNPCSDRAREPPLSPASDLALSPGRSAKAASAR